ncbi:hypothetical protein BG000_000467 [Podila horticola]|nr:hypothetical protein BG000_000467 [Podila horticola]
MKLSIFSSLAVAAALVQTASAQTSPKPDPNPINYSNADYLSNSNILVVSGGEHHDPTPTANVTLLKSLRFLNLAKDWPKTQPLWSGKGPLATGQKEPEVGPIGLDKDGVKVYLFGPKQHQIYNLQSNMFEPAVNYTKTPFHPQKHTFTDPTSGYIYGLSCVGAKGAPGTSPRCSMASFNPANGIGAQLAQGPADLDPRSRGVYSKTTKSVFYYPYDFDTKLHSYNIESNTWTIVEAKGTGPSPRSGACFTGSGRNNTTTLILAGGFFAGDVLSDIYEFDVKTSEWKKLPTNLPNPFSNGVCAIGERALVIHGGYHYFNGDEKKGYFLHNNDEPVVFDFITNKWEDQYTAKVSPPSSDPSSPTVKVSGAYTDRVASIAGAMTATAAALVMAYIL